jgi:hypothetical protein
MKNFSSMPAFQTTYFCSGKSFNASLKSSFGYVAVGVLLP